MSLSVGASARELLAPPRAVRCTGCGRVRHYPAVFWTRDEVSPYCPACKSADGRPGWHPYVDGVELLDAEPGDEEPATPVRPNRTINQAADEFLASRGEPIGKANTSTTGLPGLPGKKRRATQTAEEQKSLREAQLMELVDKGKAGDQVAVKWTQQRTEKFRATMAAKREAAELERKQEEVEASSSAPRGTVRTNVVIGKSQLATAPAPVEKKKIGRPRKQLDAAPAPVTHSGTAGETPAPPSRTGQPTFAEVMHAVEVLVSLDDASRTEALRTLCRLVAAACVGYRKEKRPLRGDARRGREPRPKAHPLDRGMVSPGRMIDQWEIRHRRPGALRRATSQPTCCRPIRSAWTRSRRCAK